MKRKQYVHKLWKVSIDIHNKLGKSNIKLGEVLKHNKNFAKEVPKKFGSYEAAWNDECIVKLREMLDNIK